MRRRPFAKLLQSAALLAVLLAAQTATLVHAEAEDLHPAGEVCALCVGLATFGSGAVPAPQHVDVVVQTADAVEYLRNHAVPRRVAHRFARGPPQAS